MADPSLTDALQPGENWQQSVERRLRELSTKTPTLGDLPLAALQRSLENDWQPDANVLLAPRSVSLASLQWKLVGGIVSSAGAITAGGTGDWTCSRAALGIYDIVFAPVFAGVPAVVALPISAGIPGFELTTTPTITTFRATAWVTNTGAGFDTAFSFIAFGLGGS